MNAATTATIRGDKITLIYGTHYRVSHAGGELGDALLDSREPNGDLIFLVSPDGDGANGGRRRIRPARIDAIFGSGVDHPELAETEPDPESVITRRPGESAAGRIARLDRSLGRKYVRWISTEAGQAALADVTAEERANRPKLTKVGKAKLVAAGVDPAAVASAGSLEDLPKSKRSAKPYSERNQVWKCGSCKRRTRLPICTGKLDLPHPPVDAPAGKRRDDRTPK